MVRWWWGDGDGGDGDENDGRSLSGLVNSQATKSPLHFNNAHQAAQRARSRSLLDRRPMLYVEIDFEQTQTNQPTKIPSQRCSEIIVDDRCGVTGKDSPACGPTVSYTDVHHYWCFYGLHPLEVWWLVVWDWIPYDNIMNDQAWRTRHVFSYLSLSGTTAPYKSQLIKLHIKWNLFLLSLINLILWYIG